MRSRSTTILSVRKDNAVALGGDGQVTLGNVVAKADAVKIRRVGGGKVLTGFAGSAADAFALLERFEKKLSEYPDNTRRAVIELAKEWRTDRVLRRLEAMLAVVDNTTSLIVSGAGDVIEPTDGVIGIGSGGPYAASAAKALLAHSSLGAKEIVEAALHIAGEMCIYTNTNIKVETLTQRRAGHDYNKIAMQNLTPRQIVSELDRYIVGQSDAKRAVAVAIRNRWRRQQLDESLKQDVWPKNIIMSGPTGVGKTEIARRLASLTGAPFIKVEATKYTEVGYHGRDVESMIRDLLDSAINMVRGEMTEDVKPRAEEHVEDRLLDYLLPTSGVVASATTPEDDETKERHENTREKLRTKLREGKLEDRTIEIQIEERSTVVGVLGNQAMEMDIEFQSMFEKMLPSKRETRKLTIADARKVLFAQEADKLIDRDKIHRTAIERVEQTGIVFLDEIDKIAGTDKTSGPDVSRQGVQRDLLPIVEGSTVITKYGPVRTDHILFIAAGAFHSSKPSDLMPELQGRFPIRVELKDLTKEDFVRILHEPKNALTTQQIELLKTEGLSVKFQEDAIDAMAQIAFDVNRRTQNIGARRLYTIMERVFEQISFEAPDLADKSVTITAQYVRERLAEVVKDEDLSKFIL